MTKDDKKVLFKGTSVFDRQRMQLTLNLTEMHEGLTEFDLRADYELVGSELFGDQLVLQFRHALDGQKQGAVFMLRVARPTNPPPHEMAEELVLRTWHGLQIRYAFRQSHHVQDHELTHPSWVCDDIPFDVHGEVGAVVRQMARMPAEKRKEVKVTDDMIRQSLERLLVKIADEIAAGEREAEQDGLRG